MSKKPPKGTMLVFVYGTLLSGLRNHHILSSDSRCTFVCNAITKKTKFLVHNNSYPALLHKHFDTSYDLEKNKMHVIGEIWRVPNDLVLSRLDHLEGYNPQDVRGSYYLRDELQFIDISTGKVKRASVYTMTLETAKKYMPYVCENGNYRSCIAE